MHTCMHYYAHCLLSGRIGTVLLPLPTYHTIQMTHLPHAWLLIHDDSM